MVTNLLHICVDRIVCSWLHSDHVHPNDHEKVQGKTYTNYLLVESVHSPRGRSRRSSVHWGTVFPGQVHKRVVSAV